MAPDRLHAITGHAPPYIFAVSRLLWFRQHHDASRIATVFMLNDWITYLLTGARVAEHSNASESMLYDVTERARGRTRSWTRFDIPRAILPPLCDAGSAGRSRDRPRGGGDRHPRGHAGVRRRRRHGERAARQRRVRRRGRSARCSARPRPCRRSSARPCSTRTATSGRAPTWCPDRWVLESNGGDTGSTYRWLLELMCGGVDDGAHALAEAAMADGRPGAARDLLSPRTRRLQPAEHESVPAGGPALPLPASPHRPSEARRSAARLLRERRLRDPRQLRADHGGLRQSDRTALGERRHDAAAPRCCGSWRRRSVRR